eukprot:7893313-Ditylum_brightwellii.AAC.1
MDQVAMMNVEYLQGVNDKQCGSWENKSTDIQALKTRLYYDYFLLERVPATSALIDLVSTYDLVVHSNASLALKQVNIPKTLTHCTFTTLQSIVYTMRM